MKGDQRVIDRDGREIIVNASVLDIASGDTGVVTEVSFTRDEVMLPGHPIPHVTVALEKEGRFTYDAKVLMLAASRCTGLRVLDEDSGPAGRKGGAEG